MLGSFLEGAKATVRRAGAVDLNTGSVGREKTPLRSSQDASSRDSPHQSSVEGSAGRGADSSSAAQSVSRSFSLLKASGARVRDAGGPLLCLSLCALEEPTSLLDYIVCNSSHSRYLFAATPDCG